jgi:hypothetical protein
MNTSTNPITPPGLIDDIRSLVATCGPGVNQNDKAIVAIELCISQGVDTEGHIVGCLMRAGFGNRHAGTVLNKNAGGAPNRHRWWRDAAGRYRVHTEEAALGV